jgi:hypothetical protein
MFEQIFQFIQPPAVPNELKVLEISKAIVEVFDGGGHLSEYAIKKIASDDRGDFEEIAGRFVEAVDPGDQNSVDRRGNYYGIDLFGNFKSLSYSNDGPLVDQGSHHLFYEKGIPAAAVDNLEAEGRREPLNIQEVSDKRLPFLLD